MVQLITYAYKFVTPDKTIIISGDLTPNTTELYEKSKGCDILVHEVFCESGVGQMPEMYKKYMFDTHTPARTLGKKAEEINVGKLVLTHQIVGKCRKEDLLNEIKENYTGQLFYGNDLDVFE